MKNNFFITIFLLVLSASCAGPEKNKAKYEFIKKDFDSYTVLPIGDHLLQIESQDLLFLAATTAMQEGFEYFTLINGTESETPAEFLLLNLYNDYQKPEAVYAVKDYLIYREVEVETLNRPDDQFRRTFMSPSSDKPLN